MIINPKPVHVLTGFLGAGKTTLLNRLLKSDRFSRTLVIVNEFGEISLDHHLYETTTETIFELANGCLCCNMRGELVETLLGIDCERFDRIVIETTGIADPLPVLQSLSLPEIANRGLVPGLAICVFDAERGPEIVDGHTEAQRQLALADLVFVSHQDAEKDITATEAKIRQRNPHAVICRDASGIEPDTVVSGTKNLDQFPVHAHQSAYRSIRLQSSRSRPVTTLVGFLHHLASAYGSALLRVKGFALCDEAAGPCLLQMSGQFVHEPVFLEEWPMDCHGTNLVVIVKDADPELAASLFGSFFDIPAVDQPDRDAILNNPLSIPGG